MTGALLDVVRRAPVAIACTIPLAAGLHAQIWYGDAGTNLFLAGVAAFAAATAVYLARPAGLSANAAAFAAAGGAAVGIAAAQVLWLWPPLLAAATLPLTFVAAALRESEPRAAWEAMLRTAAAAAVGLAAAGALFLGLMTVEGAAAALLRLGRSDEPATVHLAPVIFGIVAPVAFLALATSDRGARIADGLGVVARAFGRFIAVPLLAAFAVIVYVYIGRIAATGELPSNEVGWIVPVLGAAGAATFVALAGETTPGRPVRLFRTAWFPLMLLPAALLAVSVGVRVAAYGLTPERYVLILVAAWLAILALAFTAPGRRDARLVPLTLSLVLALGAVGPWGAIPLVVKSQRERLASLPEAAVATLGAGDRDAVCSAVAVIERVRPGAVTRPTSADCARPPAPLLASTVVHLGAADTVALDRPATLWGPVAAYDGMAEAASADRRLTLSVADATVTVRDGAATHRFDLGAVAAGATGAVPTPPLRDGGLTLVVRDANVEIGRGEARLLGATLLVIAPPAGSAAP